MVVRKTHGKLHVRWDDFFYAFFLPVAFFPFPFVHIPIYKLQKKKKHKNLLLQISIPVSLFYYRYHYHYFFLEKEFGFGKWGTSPATVASDLLCCGRARKHCATQ